MSLEQLLHELEIEKAADCYHARLKTLKSWGRNTSIIEKGVEDCEKALTETRSFVVYGEPQSGKTEFMIALVCRLIDLGKQTIFVVMNDNTELESQNYHRFLSASELNPTPLRDFELLNMEQAELRIPKQRIIFCRKNSPNLQKLIELCEKMVDRVVIDDEADFATPNAKIAKKEQTAINAYVGMLGDLGQEGSGVYIGVTATPGRLDLNNTYFNDSRHWVWLQSHANYKGRSFFFPINSQEINSSDYQLVKLPDESDDPKLLRHAVFRFLLRVAILNLHRDSEITPYSMLIHTAGQTNDHEKDQKDLRKILGVLQHSDDLKHHQYLEEMLKIGEDLVIMHDESIRSIDLVKFVVRNIGRRQELLINHKNDSGNVQRAGKPETLFTFAIGGNIVSRGLTFENLLTFYFSRNVKNRLQQNTYIQRARMFGNRPYSKYFELCVPAQLFEDWATCFHNHELSVTLGKAGVYQHIQSGRTSVADRPAIDLENVTIEKSERVVGDIFEFTPEIESALINLDKKKPLTALEELLANGFLSTSWLPKSLLEYLRNTARADESDVLLVFRNEDGTPVIQNIERYTADGDPETITRRRGGIVHAMLNKNPLYDLNNHFILPIRNDSGQARFLYKSNMGHTILQNLRVSKPINRV